MGCLAEQHDARRPDTLHQRAEIGRLDGWKRFSGVGEITDQRFLIRSDRPKRSSHGRGLAFCSRPPLLSDQWNEADIGNVFVAILVLRNADDAYQFLAMLIGADRNHQPAADLQLLLERLWNLRTAGGHHDGVVGRMLGPAFGPVTMQNVDVIVTEFRKCDRRLFRERTEAFDRVHIGRNLRQHRGGVTGAGSDLQHLLAALEHQRLRHESDDVGLRNGLLPGDRERRIFVGKFAKLRWQEQLSRHLAHCLEHEFVTHTARGDIVLDHLRPERGKRLHLFRVIWIQR